MATAGTITNIEIVTEKINGVSIKGYNKDNGKFQPLQPTPAPTPASTPCLLYTSPSPRDGLLSRMPSSA